MLPGHNNEADVAAVPGHGSRGVAGVLDGFSDDFYGGGAVFVGEGENDILVLGELMETQCLWLRKAY